MTCIILCTCRCYGAGLLHSGFQGLAKLVKVRQVFLCFGVYKFNCIDQYIAIMDEQVWLDDELACYILGAFDTMLELKC